MPVRCNKRRGLQPEELSRSISPFDYQASFVPFVSMQREINAVGRFSPEYNDNAPIPAAKKWPHLPGHKYLAGAIGYRVQSVDVRTSRLICADALTCIEKLTSGAPRTRRPRGMEPIDIQKKLLGVVPASYLRRHEVSLEQCGVSDEIWAVDRLAIAVGSYIRDLKTGEQRRTENGKRVGEAKEGDGSVSGKEISDRDHAETVVEKALGRIESWCNDWLAGNVSEMEWNKMERVCEG